MQYTIDKLGRKYCIIYGTIKKVNKIANHHILFGVSHDNWYGTIHSVLFTINAEIVWSCFVKSTTNLPQPTKLIRKYFTWDPPTT